MRYFILLLFVVLFNSAFAQVKKSKTYDLIVGTYTNKDKSNGIHVYSFDTNTGKLSYRSKTLDVTNPSFLTTSLDNKNVYAVSEIGKGQATVKSFSFDRVSGSLNFLNEVSAGGNGPCYVSIDNKKQFVFVGNYGSGNLSAIRVNQNGTLEEQTQTIQHVGSSLDKENQSKPHVHSVVLSPDQKYLFAADLGTDEINAYRYNPANLNPLSPANVPFTKVKAGSGPRHLVFHPNGKYAYVIMELTAEIAAFDYSEGKLDAKQYMSMLSADFEGEVEAADVHISPDGRFLYGSNRRDGNDIVIYSISKDGKLSYVGRQSLLINTPRNFAIDPTGNFLLAANMDSNNVVVFRRNRKTGLLTSANESVQVDMPVCLKFIEIN